MEVTTQAAEGFLAATALPAACEGRPFVVNMTLGPLALDYVHLHYCTLAGLPLLSFVALLLWLTALFYFLGSTADGYFSPTLASMSDRLQIPYDVAGVTFLAFGNGAPDVFSALAAYSSDVGDAGINELLGGSVFISTVVVGAVAVSSTVKVQRWPFTRDVGALVVSLLLMLLLEGSGTTSPVIAALLFLGLYVLYVGSVVLPACVSRYRVAKAEVQHATGLAPGPSEVLGAFWHALPTPGTTTVTQEVSADEQEHKYTFTTRSAAAVPAVVETPEASNGPSNLELSSPRKFELGPQFSSRVFDDHFQRFTEQEDSLSSPLIAGDERSTTGGDAMDDLESPDFLGFSKGGSVLDSAYWRHRRWRWSLKRRIGRVFSSDDPLLVKLFYVPQSVLIVARDVTVPLLDDEAWSRSKTSLAPITVPLLAAFIAESASMDICGGRFAYQVPLWQAIVVVGGCVGGLVSYVTHRSHAPRSSVASGLLLLLAFTSCVCWIYAVANELMALLVAVGYITHASTSLLGLTVLAWGNSVGDLVADVSVARAGFPEMAIAGCYGGPVFNILLGLGLPMAYAFVRGQNLDLDLDAHAWISLAFLVVSLTSSFFVFRRYKFRCPPWYGKLLMGYYLVYSVVNLVVAYRARGQPGGGL